MIMRHRAFAVCGASRAAIRIARARSLVISGLLADQPALHGLLAKIRDLGLCPISVRRLHGDETGNRPQPSDTSPPGTS